MAADPVPHDDISLHDSKGTVTESDARREDILFPRQFLELQPGMRGIALEYSVSVLGITLNVRG